MLNADCQQPIANNHYETFVYKRLETETYPIRRQNYPDRDFQRTRIRHRHAQRKEHRR